LSCQQSTSERGVRYYRDAEFSGCLEQGDLGVFDVEHEGRVLDLEGSDGVDCVCPAESLGGALRETEVFDFSFSENDMGSK
jgi:hypothetical protein